MAKIGLPKGSVKWWKVREKSVKSQGILKWILSGNPDYVPTSKGRGALLLVWIPLVAAVLTHWCAPAMIMAGALSVTPVRPSVLYVRTS